MTGEIIPEDGRTRIRLEVVDGTVWLSQAEMAALFQTTPQNMTQHIRTLYRDGELDREATCKGFLQVQTEGERQVQRRIDAAHQEADRQAAEVDYEQDIETELTRIEATATRAKRAAASPKTKTGPRTEGGE